MKATDVIRRDHKAAEELFQEFREAEGTERDLLAERIFAALDAHEEMEDTYFYPALLAQADDDSTLGEIEQEQEDLKATVNEVRAKEGEERNEELEEVLDIVLAHAKKEEREILTLAERAMGDTLLEEIGEKMERVSAVELTR